MPLLGGGERRLEVGEDVVDRLEADRQAHEAGLDAGAQLLFVAQLAVGRAAGWIARLRTSPMLATWLCSSRPRRTACRPRGRPSMTNAAPSRSPRRRARRWPARATGESAARRSGPSRPRVRRPGTRRPLARSAMCRSMRRLSVSRPWRNEERVERRDRRADVAQQLHAGLDDVGAGAERRPVGEAVVARVGLGEAREPAARREVERAAVDDHAADRRAVAADELGGRVHDDVGAPLERTDEVGRGDACCR